MSQPCSKEAEIMRLRHKVAALERDREADRQHNAEQFQDLRDQLRRWGEEFTGHFMSMRELFVERFAAIEKLLGDKR